MTSKDKIEELHNFIDNVGDKLSIVNYLVYQTYLDDIEEDLDVLEILKGHYHILDINKSLNTIELSFKLEDKEFNLIKEFFRQ